MDMTLTKQQHEARASFGIVFQDPSLDDELTAYENMNLHGMLYKVKVKDRRERIKQLLTFVELWDRKNDLVKHFSGGMKSSNCSAGFQPSSRVILPASMA